MTRRTLSGPQVVPLPRKDGIYSPERVTATVPRSSSMQIVRSTHGSRHREISTTEGDMMYKASGNTMYQLGSSVFAKSFELQQECVSIGIYCPNWSSSTKSMTLTLYKWDTDYTTTLASTPVNSRHFTSYGDNSRLQIFADKAADGSTKIPAGENTCGP